MEDELGEDVHDIKGRGGASKRDLYVDDDGNVVVKPKGGKGPGEPVGVNLRDLRNRGSAFSGPPSSVELLGGQYPDVYDPNAVCTGDSFGGVLGGIGRAIGAVIDFLTKLPPVPPPEPTPVPVPVPLVP
ncbi:MAG: hypothetical protein JOZ68_17160 [Acidimicrobiia bacterium]|nr:hypothetical protein [Acidimicrobiia bacterium]